MFPARRCLFLPTGPRRLATETLLIQRFLSRRGQQLRLFLPWKHTARCFSFFWGGKGEKKWELRKYLKVHGIDGSDGMYDLYIYLNILYIYLKVKNHQRNTTLDFLNVNPYQN